MTNGQSNLMIELEAAQMAIAWKSLFGRELKHAAQELAHGADLVTVQHYRLALPIAVSRALHTINSQLIETTHAQPRAA